MLVSIREYARRRGCSHVAVMKAAKSGRITLTDGKVDTETADRQWASNTDAAQRRDAGALAPASTVSAPGQPAPSTGSPSQITYSTQRAIREGYLARLAKIEFEVKTGKLIEVDKVRVKAFNLARKARDMLGGLPDRLAPILAGESNAFEIHRLLTEEIRRVSDEIAHSRPV
jgi:hypothetical protein